MPSKNQKRDKAKESFWRKAIARQLQSGLTQAAFCEKEQLNPNNFSWWKGEILKRDAASPEPSNGSRKVDAVFVPVVTAPTNSGGAESERVPIAEIDLSSGVVRIFSGIDRHALHEILATMREVTR